MLLATFNQPVIDRVARDPTAVIPLTVVELPSRTKLLMESELPKLTAQVTLASEPSRTRLLSKVAPPIKVWLTVERLATFRRAPETEILSESLAKARKDKELPTVTSDKTLIDSFILMKLVNERLLPR